LRWTGDAPQIDQSLQLGDRSWQMVDVDAYRLAEQTQAEFAADPVIFLNHCAWAGANPPHCASWSRVELFRQNPLTLFHLFLSPELNLIQSSIHLYSKRIKIDSSLRRYQNLGSKTPSF
jgi:hypothetical protein